MDKKQTFLEKIIILNIFNFRIQPKYMNSNKNTKIGLVQINNSFSNQSYFPYSVALLQAYAQKYFSNINDFEFLLPIYKRIPVTEAVNHL